MIEFKLYKSPLKAIKLILLCSIFVFCGIWLVTSTDALAWVGWLNIGFFGLGYPIGLYQLLVRRPQIIINTLGIFDRTTHRDFINWEIIHHAYLADVHGQKFICLVVGERFEPSQNKSKLYKGLKNISKGMGFQELNISLGQVKIDEEKLMEFILAMAQADKSKKEELLKTMPNTGPKRQPALPQRIT